MFVLPRISNDLSITTPEFRAPGFIRSPIFRNGPFPPFLLVLLPAKKALELRCSSRKLWESPRWESAKKQRQRLLQGRRRRKLGGGILLAFSEKRTVVTKLAGHCGVGKEAFSIQMFVNICSPPPKLLSLCPPLHPYDTFRSCVGQSWHLLLSDDPNLVRRSCKKHSHM